MKNQLDEMQEQKLLHIEEKGCWLAFWGLLAAICGQLIVCQENTIERLAGEWIVFMALAVYLIAGCLRNGIWDRRLKPNAKTNLLVSLVAAVLFGGFWGLLSYVRYGSLPGSLAIFAVMATILFAAVFAALSVSAALYKKRLRKLEDDCKEE